ncbi:MAG: TIGR02266 family protein [Polyangiaceae bacterium]|nr:TIGR02266 family protein [Polyangiaceae bacterium]
MSEAEHKESGGRCDDERAPITLRVDYKRLNTFFADYTKNISRGGTFIRTTRPLEIGTEFVFILSVPSAARSETAPTQPTQDTVQLELTGVVKWVVQASEASSERPAGMGIQFVFADEKDRQRVRSIVSGLMHDTLGPHLTQRLLGVSPPGSL